MEIILIKDFTSPQGRLYPAGTTYSCCRDTYNRLLAEGICDAIKGEKKLKKKTKKTIEDGDNSNSVSI